VSKTSSTGTTIYRYDGQMGMEDVDLDGSGTWQKTTDFSLGLRGIESISVTTSGGTSVSYPIYDAHGNMISTLSKNGTGYTYTAERSLDAWGNIRLGAQSGDPKGRYCANIGHKQDDESRLLYLRARYYEPNSGRFVSEDPGRNNGNWFSYAENCPTILTDCKGKASASSWVALFFFVAGLIDSSWNPNDPISKACKIVISYTCSAFGAARMACAFLADDGGKLGAGAAIAAGTLLLVSGALAELALEQFAIAIFLMDDPDDSRLIRYAGDPLQSWKDLL